MGKKKICDLHDAIIGLCFKQEELLVAGKIRTKTFKNNFKKILGLAREAKKAGQAMENRMVLSRELFKVYADEMGFKISRKKRTLH